MKPLTLLLLLISTYCLAQTKVNDSILHSLYTNVEDGKNSAFVIKTCKEYLRQNTDGESKLEAFYFTGRAYQTLKKYDSAKRYYKAALMFPGFNENNYYCKSVRYMSEIWVSEKMYDSALTCLNKSLSTDYYFMFLENLVNYNLSINLLYAECYKGKGEYQKAIKILEPHMTHNIFLPAPSEEAMDSLYALYLLIHTKAAVKTEFINALNTITITKKYADTSKIPSLSAHITIFGDRIFLNDNSGMFAYAFTKNPDTINDEYLKKQAVESFKLTRIYELATK